MKTLVLALCIALCACAGNKRIAKPAVSSAAYVATESAKLHIAKARIAVEKAKAPSNREAIVEASVALLNADKALDEAGRKIESLQAYTEQVVAAKEQAEIKAQKADSGKSFWRAWAIRLGAVSGLLGLWIFRRPILALLGVPAP